MTRFDDIRKRIRMLEDSGQAGEFQNQEGLDPSWAVLRTGCPQDEDFAAYAERKLKLPRAIATWWHIKRCVPCRVDLLALRKTPEEAAELQVQRRHQLRARSFQSFRAIGYTGAILMLALTVTLVATYQVRQFLSGLDRVKAVQTETRAKIKDAISRASEDLRGVEVRVRAGEFDDIERDAQKIAADASELRMLNERWGKVASDLKRSDGLLAWHDSNYSEGLEATQAAMNELSQALGGYADVESLLSKGPAEYGAWRQGRGQERTKLFLASSQRVLVSLQKAEAASR